MRRWIGMVALLALAACGDNGGDSASLVGNVDDGAKVFATTCAQAKCHGPDGSGSDPKSDAADLAKKVPSKTDAEIAEIITGGFALMPAQSALSAQDVADVIAYLRQEFPG